jgi:hypothetical protein
MVMRLVCSISARTRRNCKSWMRLPGRPHADPCRTGNPPGLVRRSAQTVAREGIDRLLTAVTNRASAARRFDVDMLYPSVAAVRDFGNREEILDLLESSTGIRPQFLSGEEEAASPTWPSAGDMGGRQRRSVTSISAGVGSTNCNWTHAPVNHAAKPPQQSWPSHVLSK